MSHLLTGIAGIITGLILAIPLRRAAIRYSEHGLPPAYEGPKIYTWTNGTRNP